MNDSLRLAAICFAISIEAQDASSVRVANSRACVSASSCVSIPFSIVRTRLNALIRVIDSDISCFFLCASGFVWVSYLHVSCKHDVVGGFLFADVADDGGVCELHFLTPHHARRNRRERISAALLLCASNASVRTR